MSNKRIRTDVQWLEDSGGKIAGYIDRDGDEAMIVGSDAAIASAAAAGHRKINILDFTTGGTPGLGNDDSANFLAAIAQATTGDEIVVPRGTYGLTQSLPVSTAGVMFRVHRRALLDFVPGATLANGFVFSNYDSGIVGGRIRADQYVGNLIAFTNPGGRGRLRDVFIEGHSSKPSGQTGVLISAPTGSCYFTRLIDLDIVNCDIGIDLAANESNATFIRGLNAAGTKTPIKVQSVGGLNMISDVWSQDHVTAGIDVRSSANSFQNIVTESNSGPGMVFASGANYNHVDGLINSGSGGLLTDSGTGNDIRAEQAFYGRIKLLGGTGKEAMECTDGRWMAHDPSGHVTYFGGVDGGITGVRFRVAGLDFLIADSDRVAWMNVGMGSNAMPVYADNAAAVTGGLAVGRFYRTTTGELRVRV